MKLNGPPVFKEFAAAIVPTEFMPGKVFGSGTMQPIDYCVEMAEGRIPPPSNLDLATIEQQDLAMAFRFDASGLRIEKSVVQQQFVCEAVALRCG